METKSEKRICVNCHKDFTIEPDDFLFYEKIKVPPPTWCPECRQQRRYAWRNERTLYRRNCDLCGKSTVTIYSPKADLKVYCLPCWWGDGWDPAEYGRDFDFSRSFFEQYAELQKVVPRMALLSKNSVNSDYTNHSGDNKNCFLSFCCFNGEDVLHSTWVIKSRNCLDCSYIYEGGEKLYWCINSRKSYQCQNSLLLENCLNCLYCYDCHGCNNCFMSSNLRNKSYVFKNQQYSREDYLKKLAEYELSSFAVRQGLAKEFADMLQNEAVHRYVVAERNVNSSGNLLFDSKNSKNCFDCETLEDVKNAYASLQIKSSMDIYHIGWGTELAYEIHGCKGLYNSHFCHLCYDNRGLDYCDSCQNCEDLFGCISVKKGKNMILNKKYSKEEYLALREKIIEHMKSTGEYGEFFPPSIAPISYNETQGNFYMPLTREETLARGWRWEDKVPGTFGKETVKISEIPDKIEDVPDSYLNEIFACADCSKNYNVASNELNFYRQEKVPWPRLCPTCRYKKRFSLQIPRKIAPGQCSCDKASHGHEAICPNKFETPYSAGKMKKVYCESCYNKEIY